MSVDRNGTSGVPFLAATADGDLFSKTVFIDPNNDFADGDYEISLYFSDAEVSGWQTHTGKLAANVKMVHTDSAISKVTAANPKGGGQIRVDINSNSLPGDARITVTARFQGKLRGGFGVGIPYTSIYTFTGYGPWTNTANWQANLAPPPVVPKASAIVINPSGQCVLNTQVQLQPGAGLFVQPGKEFIVTGALQVQ